MNFNYTFRSRVYLILTIISICQANICGGNSNPCEIKIGIPLVDTAIQASQRHISFFQTSAGITSVSLLASLFYGTIDIYVATNRIPTPSDFDSSTIGKKIQDFLSIDTRSLSSTDKTYIVIIPQSQTLVQILLTNPTIPTVIPAGIPIRYNLNIAETVNFIYIPTKQISTLVSVTPLSKGDPDLKVRGPVVIPGNTTSQRKWISNSIGADYVQFTPAQTELNQNFQIQIIANTSTYCTILISEYSEEFSTKLLSGFPQVGYVQENQEVYFKLTVPPGHEEVTITLDSITGKSYSYVNSGKEHNTFCHNSDVSTVDSTTCDWRTASDSFNLVLVSALDAKFISTGGVYFITVYGKTSSKFLVRGYTANTVITLTPDTPVQGWLTRGAYNYYRVYDFNIMDDFEIDVKPIVGDADLSVSCQIEPTGSDDGYPSRARGHHELVSEHAGEDAIAISAQDKQTKCFKNGIYYIGVYGFSSTNTKYVLSAMTSGEEKILRDGQIYHEQVFLGLNKYYKFFMGVQKTGISIRVTISRGDCDLFVRLNKKATPTDYDYSSLNWGTTAESVYIPEAEMCSECSLSILIKGFKSTQYDLVIRVDDTTLELTDGLPLVEGVEGRNMQYYSYNPVNYGNLTVVLTVFSGKPLIFMSKTAIHPNSTSNAIINDEILYGNLPIATLINLIPNHIVYIGVGGANDSRHDSRYTIRATLTSDTTSVIFLKLLDGIPQNDYISNFPYGWKYYIIPLYEGHEYLNIRATKFVGDMNIYVSKCPYLDSYKCLGGQDIQEPDDGGTGYVTKHVPSYLPNTTYYIATSKGISYNSLQITRADNIPYTYIIAVRSDSFYAEYSLSVTVEHSVLTLIPGVPILDHVEEKEIDIYQFYLDSSEKVLKIILTPFSGDAELSIKCQKNNNTWFSNYYGVNAITIDPFEDPKACYSCTYFIYVHGLFSSSYSITAKYDYTNTHLLDGVPVEDTVGFFEFNYYTFHNVFKDTKDFVITITATYGDPEVIVTLNGDKPDWLNFQYEAANSDDPVQTITISRTDSYYEPCLYDACNIRIGVYGFEETSYSLVITSTSTAEILQFNSQTIGNVGEGLSNLYKAIVNRERYSLSLTFKQTTGHIEAYIYCSKDNIVPSKDNAMWTVNADVTANYIIASDSALSKGCQQGSSFLISVYGKTAATYSISAQFEDETAPFLLPGLESANSVSFKKLQYYYLPVGHLYYHFHLSVTSISGDVRMYVSASWKTRPILSPVTNTSVISYVVEQRDGSNLIVIYKDQAHQICASASIPLCRCKLVVGVFGKAIGVSTYRILYTTEDATVTLSSGAPIRSRVDKGEYQYYKYTQTIKSDVIVSVTPFSGDPDVFISANRNRHPSKTNYTWIAASFGIETLTIQSHDISKYCTPKITGTVSRGCDIFISVYGAQNSSYSLVVTMNEGFNSPVVLVDNQLQHGHVDYEHYMYYKFIIGANGNTGVAPESIVFTMTPQDDGDQDMYVTFGEGNEPGISHYDYRSTSFAGTSDEIVIHADMPHYCFNCVVNIAVYGFEAGSFTIVAHSKGFIQLQADVAIGGHVSKQSYRYYSFYNSDSLAELTVTVTPITGDPDIFINSFYPNNTNEQIVLPTREKSKWKSYRPGGDTIAISYKDYKFCFDCEYVIGVYGYRNSSYTILLTLAEASTIQLTKNRPQLVTAKTNSLKYFKLTLGSSSEDVTISLTCLDTGSADIYVQIYNASIGGDIVFPDPINPKSYWKSTVGMLLDTVQIPGPHRAGTFIGITAKTTATTQFSIVATSTQDLLMLRPGVPQNHYVSRGNMEYFRFPIIDFELVQITLTAKSGDPDLVVSATSQRPHCDVSQEMWWMVNCYNYTWSSRLYATDQIIISRDFPCKQYLTTTKINSNCDPSAISDELYIGVFGFDTSEFSIMAQQLGQRVQLLPGKPQLGVTAYGYVCSQRNERGGACNDHASVALPTQIAYFTFHVSAQDFLNAKSASVFITVDSQCHSNNTVTDGKTKCVPGCACSPFEIYVKTCPMDKCTAKDMYPSYLDSQNDFHLAVDEYSSTLFISSDPKSIDYSSSFCNPLDHIEGCNYYISVLHRKSQAMGTFSITARTPGDMNLIPCDSSPSPDGIRYGVRDSTVESMKTGKGHYFDICVENQNGDGPGSSETDKDKDAPDYMVVTIEECAGVGNMKLYACSNSNDKNCDGVLPTYDRWGYFGDRNEMCHKNSLGNGKKTCTQSLNHIPTLTLPKTTSNYYLMLNGSAEYYLRIQNTGNNMQNIAPVVVRPGVQDTVSTLNLVADSRRPIVKMTWTASAVILPGSNTPLYSTDITYTAFIIDIDLYQELLKNKLEGEQARFDTQCGLEFALQHYSKAIQVVILQHPTNTEKKVLSHEFRGLDGGGKKYQFILLASCDGNCLRLISKSTPKSHEICSGVVDCKTQYSVYMPSSVISADWSIPSGGGSDGRNRGSRRMAFLRTIITFSAIFVIVLIICLLLLGRFYYKLRNEEDEQFELTHVYETDRDNRNPLSLSMSLNNALSSTTSPIEMNTGNNINSSNPFAMLDSNQVDVPDRKSRWSKIGMSSKQPFEPLIPSRDPEDEASL